MSASVRRQVERARLRLNGSPRFHGDTAGSLVAFINAHSRETHYKSLTTWQDVEDARARDEQDRLAGSPRLKAWLANEETRPVPSLLPSPLGAKHYSQDGIPADHAQARKKLKGTSLRAAPHRTASVEECRDGGLLMDDQRGGDRKITHGGYRVGERQASTVKKLSSARGSKAPKARALSYSSTSLGASDPYLQAATWSVKRTWCNCPKGSLLLDGPTETPSYLRPGAFDWTDGSATKKGISVSRPPSWHKVGPGSIYSATRSGVVTIEMPTCQRCGKSIWTPADLRPVLATADRLGLRLVGESARALTVLAGSTAGACNLLTYRVLPSVRRAEIEYEREQEELDLGPAPPPRLGVTWENAGAAKGPVLWGFLESEGVLQRVLSDRSLESHLRRYREGRNATFEMVDRIFLAVGLHPSQAPQSMWLEKAPRPTRRVSTTQEELTV